MSSKLDKSLEEIAGSRRTGATRAARRGKKVAAPQVTGGISKRTATKASKPVAQPAAPVAPLRGESKIIVSNLPADVNEGQIQEYFSSTVGPVKKVLMNYTKNGRSTGVATIIFAKPQHAAEAAKSFDNVKVDGRPMKIEVILGAKHIAPPPAPKTLGERIAVPKSAAAKPKAAAASKATPKTTPATTNGTATRGQARGRGRNRKAPGRPKKTAEELDADMEGYFAPGTNGDASAAATTNGTAAPAAAATGGDAMEDDIM